MKKLYDFKQRHARVLMGLLIFLVIPTVAGLAFGYEMGDDKIQRIPTVVADYDNSEFSRTLVEYIGSSDIFQITGQVQRDSEARRLLETGQAMTAVIIPQGLSAAMQAGTAPKIEVLYDATSMTVASSAKAAMSEILMTVKAGYMKNIYEGKLGSVELQAMKQIQPVDATYRTLFNPAKNYRNFLLPGMLAALLQVGFAIVGLSLSLSAREEGLKTPMGAIQRGFSEIVVFGGLGAASMGLCLFLQYALFSMPFQGSLPAAVLLTYLFGAAMTAFGYLVGQLVGEAVFATQLTCVLVIPTSILGGYTFPLMAMPEPLQRLGRVFPLTYYGDGIRRLCLGPLTFSDLMPELKALFTIIIVELGLLAGVILLRSLAVRKNEVRVYE